MLMPVTRRIRVNPARHPRYRITREKLSRNAIHVFRPTIAIHQLRELLSLHGTTQRKLPNTSRYTQHALRRHRRKSERASKARIAREQLIAAQPGKRHRDPFALHSARHDVSVDAIHRWLIDRRNRARQDFKQTIFAEPYLGMIRVETFRNRTREWRF